MKKKRILTGDRPTGNLHIGHLFGSLQNRAVLQDKYETFIEIADVQALTDNFKNPEKVRKNVREVCMDNLSVGVSPEKACFFIQSLIPEIAELTVFFSNLVTIARLQRNPTVKQEIQDKKELFGKSVTFGFLGYPVSQAADIAIVKTNVVPVGEDQLPMIEQTREIVAKFNSIYGQTFPVPEALLGKLKRLKGLDGKNKMGKSLGNAIYLNDSPQKIRKLIKSAKTDSGREIIFDQNKKPCISNLILLYSSTTNMKIRDVEREFVGLGYAAFKEKLADELIKFLEPVQEKRRYFEKNKRLVDDILLQGSKKVKKEAEKTMELVRRNMKLDYFKK